MLAAAAAIAVAALFAFGIPYLTKGPTAELTDGAKGGDDSAGGSQSPVKPLANKLAPFYAALGKLEAGSASEPMTILHLGDSHIAADHITGEVRRLLQARFGDAGRGLMMPVFPSRVTRRQASASRSKGRGRWRTASTRSEAMGSRA